MSVQPSPSELFAESTYIFGAFPAHYCSELNDTSVSSGAPHRSQRSPSWSFQFETGAEIIEDLHDHLNTSYHLLERDDI